MLPALSETRRCPSHTTGRPTRTAYSRCRAGCCCLLDCRQILHLSGIGSRRHRIPYSLGLPQEKVRCSLACTGGCLAMRDGRTVCRLAPSQEWLCQRMPALWHRLRQACRHRTYGKCCALRWRQRLLQLESLRCRHILHFNQSILVGSVAVNGDNHTGGTV